MRQRQDTETEPGTLRQASIKGQTAGAGDAVALSSCLATMAFAFLQPEALCLATKHKQAAAFLKGRQSHGRMVIILLS